MPTSAMSACQEFVRATVHLAGEVEIETGHVTRFTVEHVQARIGSALLYLLDFTAAADFARAALAAAERAGGLFTAGGAGSLPVELVQAGQDSSVIVRMCGAQPVAYPQAVAGSVSRHGRAYLTCQVGGLVLVLHDAEATGRLVAVAETVHRVAAALWPVAAQTLAERGPDGGRDRHAEAWERGQAGR
ncbi:hypothetical protein SAMN05660350_04904 [Geodermatophilus obscurus]|uniref:Uncharacterized protein n=1 Tax=Geodermatophilus obscurus TaxID=1861 RepID=A0A1M7V0Y3_9ACTN|nr:hypothetical protein [Geodermatophilus obscurus]SHN88913.1 hypothetical protein SAMN05660350_04904 [Geodermatophilus obscurus]